MVPYVKGGIDCSTFKVLNRCRFLALQSLESCEMQQPWYLSSKLVIFKTKMSAATPKYLS